MSRQCRLPANRASNEEAGLSTCDLLVRGGHVATMAPAGAPYGAVRDAAIAITDGRIAWVGPAAELPAEWGGAPTRTLDVGGAWITPGLIDCHTHTVFAGDRAEEWERRLGGATYESIAAAGGGILSTVRATRAASSDALFASALARLRTMRAHGVTTVEVKSGYGLDVPTELRMLSVARSLAAAADVTVYTTLLGAHALPPEFAHDRRGYIDVVCEEMIPRAVEEGLADATDAFCEGIGFTPDECARVLDAGTAHGLAGRLHADQLSDLGGAELAARLGARSADHLEYTSETGVVAMAEAGAVAVLLPGAFYFLGATSRPPIDAMREHGVAMAVATDFNPGSSPVASPLLAMNMASVLFGLTPEESLAGMTRVAARVLGMEAERGVIRAGSRADLAIWEVGHPAELSYWMASNPCRGVIRDGRPD